MSNVVFVFTDECGVYEKIKSEKMIKAHPYYVRSNLMISLEDYNKIEDKITKLKDNLGLPQATEIKWSHMGTLLKNRDVGYDINLDKIKVYFRDVAKLINDCKSIKLYFTITKLSETNKIDKVKLIKMHLQNAYQKIEMEIGEDDKKAIVIADDLNSENKKLKKELYKLAVSGDRFLDYKHIYKGLFVDYSDQCCGLQLADICAGIMTASLKYVDSEDESKYKYQFAYDLLTQYLFGKIRTDDRGASCEVYGFGIKNIPKGSGEDCARRMAKVIEKTIMDDFINDTFSYINFV